MAWVSRKCLLRLSSFLAAIILVSVPVAACSFVSVVSFQVSHGSTDCAYKTYPLMDEDGNHSTERYRNHSISSLENYQECVTSNMSEKERHVLENVTEEFNRYRFSYLYDSVHVVEQSEEEYDELLREAERINDDRCECLKYRNITRYPEVGWTVYARDSVCGNDTACRLVKPNNCSNPTENILDFLIGLPGLILAALVGLVSVLVFKRARSFF